ncbi:hypothetical protein [Pseudomonas sp. GM_Psu_2]|uniref:hypothetical protein n=1 Tax=unclassified Pseudomonas TaxID=196821 RepID=UPI00226984CE|nr:hypothetical protein [Pseudomonas sp. GM_Psu_2]
MESYKRYQEAKRELAAAHSWLSNKTKIDSQSNSRYQLRAIKVHGQYCGQSYAGANNYHESPEAFDAALAAVIRENFDSLSHAAIGLLEKKLREALIECESDVAALSDEIATAKLSS